MRRMKRKWVPDNASGMMLFMKKRVLVFSKRRATPLWKQETELVRWLESQGHDVVDVTQGTKGPITDETVKAVCLGVVIGGDGTFLRLVRRLQTKDGFPLIGVNLGSLGFITEFSRAEMLPAVSSTLIDQSKEDARVLMQVELWRGGKKIESGTVFNDAVVTKDARTSMLKLDVSIAGEFLSYVRADGYIVATPTGSTAYNLSVGGPLLHPEVNGMVLAAICSHSLSARPIVVPQRMEVEISPREFNGSVYLLRF